MTIVGYRWRWKDRPQVWEVIKTIPAELDDYRDEMIVQPLCLAHDFYMAKTAELFVKARIGLR